MTDLSEEANPDSVYYKYCAACEKCGRNMDHPPITLPITPGIMKSKGGLEEYIETGVMRVCRFCLLEAIAPIDEKIEGKDIGWWWRKIINGEIEPLGTRKAEKYNPETKANAE